MNKTLIIILREYTTRVSKKSFILLTLLMPFLFAAIATVPFLLGKIKSDEQQKVVIIDKTGQYFPLFHSDEHYLFSAEKALRPEFKSDTTDVEAVVLISDLVSRNPNAVTIYGKREIQTDLQRTIEDVLTTQLRKEKLKAYNIPQLDNIIDDVQQEFSVTTVKWGKDGEETFSSSDLAIGAGFVFTMLIYIFVLTYGGMVMQSVMEEKTNRIMEIMVSSVKPFQLMMGKIIGVALVGFTQLLVWGIMVSLIVTAVGWIFGIDTGTDTLPGTDMSAIAGADPQALAQAASGSNSEMFTALMNLPLLELAVMFLFYFIGGYLLFASFFAAVGASVNAQEDSSQFTLPVMLFLMFGLYAAMGSLENTDGPLAFWTSIFPLTSPIVMMVRIPFGVPLWQEALSLAVLYATAVATVWLAAKIYRVGILMYGKKPTLKEMLKWVRYK